MKFEKLYEFTKEIHTAKYAGERHVKWCDDSKLLGYAKQSDGAFELFLRCDKLSAQFPLVRHHLKHDKWRNADDSGGDFSANRIQFPAEDHYQAVAAFIAEELFRNGLVSSVSKSFAASEPIIEMSLRRTALSDDHIIGLIGELRLLLMLLVYAETAISRAEMINSWQGYRNSARDFVFEDTSVEVKTTNGHRSCHHISSISQVDPMRVDGDPTEQLYLVSLGLRDPEENSEGSFTLPSVVNDLLDQLKESNSPGKRTESQEILLGRIREYGGSSNGYDHDTMSSLPAYSRAFCHRFERIYDMNDNEVLVLRRQHLDLCDAVQEETVQFEVDLPDQIMGDINPETSLHEFAQKILSM
jgi:hypothetical protein